MKKIKSFFTKKRVIFLLVSLVLISLITVLAIFKPKIFLESVKTETISFETTEINLESSYPEFSFSDSHLIKFLDSELSASKDSSYQSKASDFSEGENKVEYCGYINLFFVRLVSSECNSLDFAVDRIAPEFKITEKGKDKVVLEDYKFKAEGEIGTEVYAEDDLVGVFEENSQEFSYKPKSGNIEVEIYSKDKLGNISSSETVKFYSFNEEGYVLREYDGLKFPVHGTLMTGDSNYFYNSDFVSPCSGPCGAVPQNISLTSNSNGPIDANFGDIKESNPLKTVTEFSEKELTTNTGITGKLGIAFAPDSIEFSNVNDGKFIFSVNNKTYAISYFTLRGNAKQAFIEEEFYKLINNIVY